jgi:UDP-N-acetylmuramate dehydrogenase
MEIKKVLLKDFTSLRIGGNADMVVVTNEDELVDVVTYAKSKYNHLYVLGEGTNTVFANNLENFLILKIDIKNISVKEIENDVFIMAGAGELWDDVVKFSVEKNLWGLENLSHVPGTVGAAPVQNIGAYGAELKDVLVSLRAYDTKQNVFVELLNNECKFGYRDSLFKKEKYRYIITSITVKLYNKARPVLTYKPLDVLSNKENLKPDDIRKLVIQTRAEKLPDYKLYPNAGSFFKNPIVDKEKFRVIKSKYPEVPIIEVDNKFKIPAAWLIEYVADMKGVRVGDIGTWPNQPLVIVNYGKETTLDDLNLFTNEIKKRVYENIGINLEQEINAIY